MQKTVTCGSVYKYRLHPPYRPNLRSQEKWQLVCIIHSTGTNFSTGTENQYQPTEMSTSYSILQHATQSLLLRQS